MSHVPASTRPWSREFRSDCRQVGGNPGSKIICLNEVRDLPGIRFSSATSMRDLAIVEPITTHFLVSPLDHQVVHV